MKRDLPRVVETRRVFTGWNTLDIVTVESDGAEAAPARHDREVIDHGEAAVVLLIDRERDVAILVKQWRAGLLAKGEAPYLLEACAGILDPGETPEECARREADEEVGIKIGKLRPLGTILPSAGTLTERMHLFVAEVSAADRTENGGGNTHEGEDIEVVEVPVPRLFQMVRAGEIEDAKTVVIVRRLIIEELERRQAAPA
jgi:nudix-type nucleoside diphosphatase (YffH/AdpP family)